MPPLPVCTPPHRPPHVKTCHPERSDRRSRAARDPRFRPCRKGSAFPSAGLPPRTDFRISNFAFRSPLATLAPGISPATHYPLLATHFLNTQDLPQTLSRHTLAHNFRDTPGWGVSLATGPLSLATVPFFSYSYALFCIPQISIPHPFNAFRTLCAKHPAWRRALRIDIPSEATEGFDPVGRNPLFSSQLAANHSPLSAIPFRIRTYEKTGCNSFRIRTYKTQDLKLFRMNTYEKTPRGGLFWLSRNPTKDFYYEALRDLKVFSLPSTFNFRRSTLRTPPPTERRLHRR